MVPNSLSGRLSLVAFLLVATTLLYFSYHRVRPHLATAYQKVAGNQGGPVNKTQHSVLMNCQERQKMLESLPEADDVTIAEDRCPIRSIIQSLYSRSTGWDEFSDNLSALAKCHSIYYPRVPKCASRTTTYIFRKLRQVHHFRPPSSPPMFDFVSPHLEYEYILNVTREAKPVLFSRQTHYINFTKYYYPPPVHINVIRDPIARLLSSYHYRIYGSNNQHNVQTLVPQCINKTIDETVAEMGSNLTTDISSSLHPCWPRGSSQLIFFCDCLSQCQKSTKSRLYEALRVLESDYLLVGMTENISDFMEALELLLPQFFRGAKNVFKMSGSNLKNQTKTKKKTPPTPETYAKLRDVLADDYTFYYAARQRFYYILQRLRQSRLYTDDMWDTM